MLICSVKFAGDIKSVERGGKSNLDVRIEFMIVVNIKIAVWWNVIACSLVGRYCLMAVRAS